MARSRFTDYLQVYPFWLIDVSPNLKPPFFVFLPTSGFSQVSSPEISLTVEDIQECNRPMTRKIISGAEFGAISLSRGCQFYDSDFNRWILNASAGFEKTRRDLLLIHFMSVSPNYDASAVVAGLAAAGLSAVASTLAGAGLSETLLAGATYGTLLGTGSLGVFELVPRLPAKAWLLSQCVPTRYKAAGDFDAMNGEISIQELEIQPEWIDEVSLT